MALVDVNQRLSRHVVGGRQEVQGIADQVKRVRQMLRHDVEAAFAVQVTLVANFALRSALAVSLTLCHTSTL
jgi:hypothetical protein